jgi:hypothetical protein
MEIEIFGQSNIAFVDINEKRSYITTALLKEFECSYDLPIRYNNGIPILDKFPFVINDERMKFPLMIVLEEEVPMIVLGEDWLEYTNAIIYKKPAIVLNFQRKSICVPIVKYQTWINNSKRKRIKRLTRQNKEFEKYQDSLYSESEIEVPDEGEIVSVIDTPVFNEIKNLESIQIQDDSSEKESISKEKFDIIDNIFDEIFQMYQEIMSDDEEPDITLNALENDETCSIKSHETESLALIDVQLIENEKPIENLDDESEKFYDYAREWMLMQQENQKQSSLVANGKRILEDDQQEHYLIQNEFYHENIKSKEVEYLWKKRRKEINQ